MIYLAMTAAIRAGIFCGAACMALITSNRISELQGMLRKSLTKDQVEYVLHSRLMPEGTARGKKCDPATYWNGAINRAEHALKEFTGV